MDDAVYLNRKARMLEDDKKREISVDQKCEEIMLWIRKMLKAWNEAIEQKYNTEDKKRTATARQAISVYKLSC